MARSRNKFYILNNEEFEMTPWQQMRAQYDAASDNYRIESRRPPMKGETPQSIMDTAAKTFYYACIDIKNQHPDVNNYPCPLTINGKSSDQYGVKMLINDRFSGDSPHISLMNLRSLSDKYDGKDILDDLGR
jgi:hypothetical protein